MSNFKYGILRRRRIICDYVLNEDANKITLLDANNAKIIDSSRKKIFEVEEYIPIELMSNDDFVITDVQDKIIELHC